MTKVLNIAIAVLILSALLFGYFSFMGRDDDTSTGVITGGVIDDAGDGAAVGSQTNGATEEDEKFVALLNELDQISLDVEFLSSAVFNSLRDFTRALPSQTKGRRNPFAPLSSSGAGNRSSNSSAPADDDGADASESDFF